ncbi:MAG: GTPase domain-containing protein [Myxococcota bacterium]
MNRSVVAEAIDAAGPWVSVQDLERAWVSRRAPPATWLLFGRQGVGKTHLANALLQTQAPVGLGGVTQESDLLGDGELRLLDGPGVEDEFDGMEFIETHLPSVHGVCWVVDGLQPATALERRVLDRSVPEWVGLVVVVSRLDLVDASEHESILNRLTALLARRQPSWVGASSQAQSLVMALAEPQPSRAPRVIGSMRAATHSGVSALAHLAPSTHLDLHRVSEDAVLAWRAEVASAHRGVVSRVKAGELVFKDAALHVFFESLSSGAERVRQRIETVLGDAPLWRPSPPQALDMWGQARDLLAGTPGVIRGLRAAGAAWASDGEEAWGGLESLPSVRQHQARSASYARAVRAMDALAEALPAAGLAE